MFATFATHFSLVCVSLFSLSLYSLPLLSSLPIFHLCVCVCLCFGLSLYSLPLLPLLPIFHLCVCVSVLALVYIRNLATFPTHFSLMCVCLSLFWPQSIFATFATFAIHFSLVYVCLSLFSLTLYSLPLLPIFHLCVCVSVLALVSIPYLCYPFFTSVCVCVCVCVSSRAYVRACVRVSARPKNTNIGVHRYS